MCAQVSTTIHRCAHDVGTQRKGYSRGRCARGARGVLEWDKMAHVTLFVTMAAPVQRRTV